jgi:hypothetical protein
MYMLFNFIFFNRTSIKFTYETTTTITIRTPEIIILIFILLFSSFFFLTYSSISLIFRPSVQYCILLLDEPDIVLPSKLCSSVLTISSYDCSPSRIELRSRNKSTVLYIRRQGYLINSQGFLLTQRNCASN